MLIYKSKENALPYKFVIHALLRMNWLVQFWNVRTPPFISHSGSIPDVLLTPTRCTKYYKERSQNYGKNTNGY